LPKIIGSPLFLVTRLKWKW